MPGVLRTAVSGSATAGCAPAETRGAFTFGPPGRRRRPGVSWFASPCAGAADAEGVSVWGLARYGSPEARSSVCLPPAPQPSQHPDHSAPGVWAASRPSRRSCARLGCGAGVLTPAPQRRGARRGL